MSEQEFATVELDLDMTDVAAWGGEQRPLPPPGDYTLQIDAIEDTTIGQNTRAFKVEFTIVDEGEAYGMKVWNNYPITQNALGRLKALMIAGGGNLQRFNSADYIGVTIAATIIHTESAGGVKADGTTLAPRTFANVMNERPVGGGEGESKAEEPAKPERPPVTNTKPADKPKPEAAKPAGNRGTRRA